MSISGMSMYTKCPYCGQITELFNYHENTSSDRSEYFNALRALQFQCRFCDKECSVEEVYTDQFSYVEDKEAYKEVLTGALIMYCEGRTQYVAFSDWSCGTKNDPGCVALPVLKHLCAMYPEDLDFKNLSNYYRGVQQFGRDYLTKLTTGDKIISPGHIKIPQCLRKVYLYNGVEIIGKRAFSGCRALWDIFLPDTVSEIEEEAFLKAGLKSIHISSQVKYIGNRAFAGCQNLTRFFIPNNVGYIGDRCFDGCNELTYMYIPRNVKLGEKVFAGCCALAKVELPSHLMQDDIHEKLGLRSSVELVWY